MALNDIKEIKIPIDTYRQLDYIHFSGAEALNCWYQFLSGTSYKRIDMRCRYLVNNNWGSSGYYSSSNNKMLLGVNDSGKTQFAVGSRYVYNTSDLINIDTTKFYDWILWSNNGSCDLSIYNGPGEVDLVGKTNSYSYTFNANAGRFYVGAYNNNGTLTGYATMDLAYIILRTENFDNIVFNGTPCQRKSDNVCGLYDSISGLFWPMEGTEITNNAAGNIVNENMPIYVKKIEDSNDNIIWGSQSAFPYRRLEYIEGDGNNYIITSSVVTTGGNVGYWFQMAFHQASPSNALVGSEKANGYTTNDRFKFGVGGGGKLYCGYANGVSANQAPVQDRFYEFYAKQGTQYIKDLTTDTNIVTSSYSLTGTNISGGHVTLFGLAQGSDTNITLLANNAGTRIKLYKIIYNNVLHIFVPAQRKSDGKCVFIDTYNGRVFEEQGSGALIPGPVVDEYWNQQA